MSGITEIERSCRLRGIGPEPNDAVKIAAENFSGDGFGIRVVRELGSGMTRKTDVASRRRMSREPLADLLVAFLTSPRPLQGIPMSVTDRDRPLDHPDNSPRHHCSDFRFRRSHSDALRRDRASRWLLLGFAFLAVSIPQPATAQVRGDSIRGPMGPGRLPSSQPRLAPRAPIRTIPHIGQQPGLQQLDSFLRPRAPRPLPFRPGPFPPSYIPTPIVPPRPIMPNRPRPLPHAGRPPLHYFSPSPTPKDHSQTTPAPNRSTPRTGVFRFLTPLASNPSPSSHQALPVNEIPAETQNQLALTAMINALPQELITNLPPDRVDPITGELNQHLRRQVENFVAAYEQLLDSELDALLASEPLLPPSIVTAMQSGQYEVAKEIIANSGLDSDSTASAVALVDRFKQSKGLAEDLRRALQAGQSLTQLEPILNALNDTISALAPPPVFQSLQQSALADLGGIVTTLQIEEQLGLGPPVGPVPWVLFGGEPVFVIYEPTVTPGMFFQAGPSLLVGSSNGEPFSTAHLPLWQAMELPLGLNGPAPTAPPAATSDHRNRVLVRNTDTRGRSVTFQVSDADGMKAVEYSIEGGHGMSIGLQNSHAKRMVTVRTAGHEPRRYQVSHGTYNFRVNEDRWVLYAAKKFRARIRNDHGIAEFRFLADDELVSLPAGESADLESDFPIVVQFDRGDGNEDARRLLEGGDYTIAIDPNTNLWDLFADAQLPGEIPLDDDHVSDDVQVVNIGAQPRW